MTTKRNNWKRIGMGISVSSLLLLLNACSLPRMQAAQKYFIGFRIDDAILVRIEIA